MARLALVAGLFLVAARALPAGEEPAPFAAPDPRDLIFYHVMIDRFDNGDPTNDGANPRTNPNYSAPSGWHGGDLEGVRRRLPYIRTLGANALWLSPLLENVNSYHGYGTFDWYAVEPNFGTLEELRALIREANDLGIAVYYDMVAGHCANLIDSTDPGWAAYKPPPDTYNLRWRTSLRYPPPFDSLDYFHAHGAIPSWTSPEQELGELSGLDDLKTETDYVRQHQLAIWSHWLRETGVSGFRVDTVKHVDRGFWEVFLPALAQLAAEEGRANYYTFGEVFGADDELMRHYVGTLDGAPYKFDAALDFQFYYTSGGVFAQANRPPSDLTGRLAWRAQRLGPTHHLITPNFLDNHDVPRFLYTAKQSGASTAVAHRRLELGLLAMFASPGPPIVYYGTEQGFDGGHDPYNREDMFAGQFEQGPSVGDNFDETSALFRFTERLASARTALEPLRRGGVRVVAAASGGPGALVFVRHTAGDAAVVLLNNAEEGERAVATFTVPELAGARVANLFDPDVVVELDASGTFAARMLAAQAGELWARADALPPPPPGIERFVPADAAVRVPTTLAALEIAFLTPMDAASVAAALTITPPVAATPAWDATGHVLTLALDEPLAANTTHTVALAAGASSAAGRPLARPHAATWTTDRAPYALPALPSPIVLPPATFALVIDGDDAEWPTAPTEPDTGAVAPEGAFAWRDAAGDDDGPGTYTYPTNAVFTGADADLDVVRVAWDMERLFLAVRPVAINASAGFFTPYFGVALDWDAEGGALRPLGLAQGSGGLGVTEAVVRADAAPEAEITFTGPRGARLLRADGSVDATSVASSYSQATGVVEMSVPWSALRGEDAAEPPAQLALVVYAGLEEHGTLREIGITATQWSPGGGRADADDPDLFDLAGAAHDLQRADLDFYDALNPTVIRHSILRFELRRGEFDEPTTSGLRLR